ncbi:MAG: class I SAM-dependent methyltransferase [Chlorobiaceae bacterium]|nr:class I SAM-dependent methyltransferase [Chlorobiaceae bacterium]
MNNLASNHKPLRLVKPIGWAGHIPFAFWITETLRPNIFVELGTHSGNSYFAVCQSVATNSLPTICHAVDTWQGDPHAGFYEENVYTEVASYNEQHYHAFSHLLKMTFDEALPLFSNGSIDLLHIDGLHTYEAVRHDFETWLPKMSAKGVVLFHDISVRHEDFGVYRLWDELSARYPHLAFDHSSGLGVLAVGNKIDPVLAMMINVSGSEEGASHIKTLYSSLGRVLELEWRNRELECYATELDAINRFHVATTSAHRKQPGTLPGTSGEIQHFADALKHEAVVQAARVENLQQAIDRIINSNSWKIMKPVRRFSKSLRKKSRKLRKSLTSFFQ